MGATGSGKSTFVNVSSGSHLPVGRSLQSCTSEVMTSNPFTLNGHTVMLIDTPGFDDTNRSDTDILSSIAAYLANSYEQGARLAGIIYMHRISDPRMGGTSKRNFGIFRELCGERTLRNVLIVTTMWSEVDPEVGEERERELASNVKFFKSVLEKGARMVRYFNTRESAHAILRHLINSKASTLQIQHEIVNEHRDLAHTSAGAEVVRVLKEQSDRHSEEIRNLRREMESAIQAKDDELRQELEEVISKNRTEIERIQRNTERMAAHFTAERGRLEARIARMEVEKQNHIRELEEHASRERELVAARDEAENRAKSLEKRLEDMTTAPVDKVNARRNTRSPQRTYSGSSTGARQRYRSGAHDNLEKRREHRPVGGVPPERNESFIGSFISSVFRSILGL